MAEVISTERLSCKDGKEPWCCISGVFIPKTGLCQIIYDKKITKLTAFTGLTFNYCPICGRKLEEDK